jgi:hypothetical protein
MTRVRRLGGIARLTRHLRRRRRLAGWLAIVVTETPPPSARGSRPPTITSTSRTATTAVADWELAGQIVTGHLSLWPGKAGGRVSAAFDG